MKRLFLFILTLTIGYALNAQLSEAKIKLLETDHDFGKFKEEAGRQTYDFEVINSGKDPLVIQNIAASCGCTIPEWTRSPIPSGGKGKITAIYDPKDRPGPFNKTLSVFSNSKPEVVVLTIRGEVIPREKSVEELFTFPVGAVRFQSNHLAFTNIKKTEKKIRVMQIVNNSDKEAKVEFDNLPPHLLIKAVPMTLKPGQKGMIEGTYDATKNAGWGNVSDMVKIKINGFIAIKFNY